MRKFVTACMVQVMRSLRHERDKAAGGCYTVPWWEEDGQKVYPNEVRDLPPDEAKEAVFAIKIVPADHVKDFRKAPGS